MGGDGAHGGVSVRWSLWAASGSGLLRAAASGGAEGVAWGASDGFAPAAAARDSGIEVGAEVR